MYKVYRIVSYLYCLLLLLFIILLSIVIIKERPEDFGFGEYIFLPLAAFFLYCVFSFTYQTYSVYSKNKQNFETIDSIEISREKTASIRNYMLLNISNIMIGLINLIAGLISLVSVDIDLYTPFDNYSLVEDIILLFIIIYAFLFGIFQLYYAIVIKKLYYKDETLV